MPVFRGGKGIRAAGAGLALAALLAFGPASVLGAAPPAEPQSPAYQGFFPPMQPQGKLQLTLMPHPRATGRVVVLGLGLPFPPGYLTDAKNLALTDRTGQEMPIHVKVLARWQQPVPGAPSIRAVLIQFRDYMATRLPRHYTVHWGRPRRQNLARGWPARKDWLPVTDGSYPPGVVYDPPAWALLPPAWLGKALLKGRLSPAGSQPGFAWLDRAMANYFGHTIGQPSLSKYDQAQKNSRQRFRLDYQKKYEPWLYDRAATQFVLYLRTGKLAPLRAAHRSAQYYASQVAPDGKFALLGPRRGVDLKYASQEGLTLDYFFTGDQKLLEASARLVKALDSWDPDYSPQRTFWTERHLGMGLLTAVAAYEMTGDPQMLARARHLFAVGYGMQIQPPPGAPRDGCLIHDARQHGQKYGGWFCSPWMSVLFVDAALRYYIVSADPRVPQSILLLGGFMVKHGTYRFTVGKGNKRRTFTLPYYMASSDKQTGKYIHDDKMHALDTSKILAAAYYFAGKLGLPRTEYKRLFNELMQTAQWPIPPVAYGRKPSYINVPPRRFNWWFRTTGDLSWLMGQP